MKKNNKIVCAALVGLFCCGQNMTFASGYTLTSVSSQGTNTITKYVYDATNLKVTPEYYQVGLTKTTYGTGASTATVNLSKVPITGITITANYGTNDYADNTSSAINNPSGTSYANITGKNFISNNVQNSANGAAIQNSGTMSSITSNFINNSTNTGSGNYSNGGAIFNNGSITGVITGDFIENHVIGNASSTDNNGGAIFNLGTMSDVTGNFVENYVSSQVTVHGGAVSNSSNSSMGNITGDFISNYATSSTGNAAGGAVYNDGTISNVKGDFLKNNATSVSGNSSGGAIFNTGKITNGIKGDFIENSATSTSGIGEGGAVYNVGAGSIGDVKGDFIGNSATVSGAIYNSGTINSITQHTEEGFTKNKATTGNGGAIYNDGKITNGINSNFISNSATKGVGGAIYNTNQIGDIKGNFELNTSASGGAIFNVGNGKIASINGSNFTSNLATNGSGGAIYNNGAVGASTNTSANTVISGTYKSNSATNGYGGAIFNDGHIYGNIAATFGGTGTNDGNSADKGGAIFNVGNGTITSIKNSTFISNTTKTYDGGAIYNNGTIGTAGSKEDVISGTFLSNKAVVNGGAIFNDGTIYGNISGTFGGDSDKDGNSAQNGGAIYTNKDLSINNATFKNNAATNGNGGAIWSSGKLDLTNASFDKNTATGNGGAISNTGTMTVNGGTFTNNAATTGNGGAISNTGTLNLIANTNAVTFSGNKANGVSNSINNATNGTVNVNAGSSSVTFNDTVSGDGTGSININKSGLGAPTNGAVNLNTTISDNQVNMYNGTLNVASTAGFKNTNVSTSGGTIAMANNAMQNLNLGNYQLNGTTSTTLDANLITKQMDTFTVSNFAKSGNNTLNITSLNLQNVVSSDATVLISPLANITDPTVKQQFQASIRYTGTPKILTPIFKYNISYNPESGYLTFDNPGHGTNYNDYNPTVFASPVAQQLGGYLVQLNSYEQAFMNMDMDMLMTKRQREAMKYRNKYAAADGDLVYDPTMMPVERSDGWFRMYSSFENVPLKNGPTVSNVMYGSFMGGDSPLYGLKNGWEGKYGVYVGYNGSHQTYDGIGMWQNGGTLGVSGTFYKGNFFTGLTANVSASQGEANNMYGTDNFNMLMSGAAVKSGYNFEFKEGRLILQPSLQVSYSFVNTFDYTNASGVRISSDPLNAIQVEPGLKIIGNLNHGWQPYAGVSFIYNIIDETHYHANYASLPELSVKPYVKYGIGVRKTIGERLTGFIQTFLTNGGRNGIGFQLGIRCELGKKPTSTNNTSKTSLKTLNH